MARLESKLGTAVIRRLRRLVPREFEHLCYDLLVLSGLRNAIWRTPGPDQGRDIEGEFLSIDLSEGLSVQRWYVECKRYKASLDWPTTFSKLAYAANHDADFLLLITTSHVSPRAREEIARRALRHERPMIRVWDAPSLENLVIRHPFLLDKYRIHSTTTEAPRSALIGLASRTIQSAYGHGVLAGDTSPALEYAASLVDLLAARQEWHNGWSRFRHARDAYPWLHFNAAGDVGRCDSYSLRALVAAIRFYTRMASIEVTGSSAEGYSISIAHGTESPTLSDALHTIALSSNLEVELKQETVRMRIRN
jgi:hypothetical protein